MSLTGALNTATMGLTASAAQSQITSSNVSNAMTEGYVRREGVLVTGYSGQGGVLVNEIRREVDAALVRLARSEGAKMAHTQVVHEALSDYTLYLGQPGSGLSIADHFSDFNSTLTTLMNNPSSSTTQADVVNSADELARSIRDASDSLATMRAEVDMEIRYEVADLNQAMYDLANLNQRILLTDPGSVAAADMLDARDSYLDQIAGVVDIRITTNSDGTVNVYTTGGAALVEGQSVQDISFDAGTGQLFAGLSEISAGTEGVRGIEHGSLAGLSELKNEIIPQFQLQLDEYARVLIETFEGADASLSPGQAGLFTDNGLAFDATNLDGLASRIRINDLINPKEGGDVSLIRDGLGAVADGDPASNSQIEAFISALSNTANVDPDTGLSPDVTLANFAIDLITHQSTVNARAESDYYAARSAAEIVQASRANNEGVNIDEEMQKLLLIEQSYAANSQVLSAISNMIDTLLASV